MSGNNDASSGPFGDLHPYRDEFKVYTQIPEHGVEPAEILAFLERTAAAEDSKWESGKVSGTIYHGGHEHYAFLNRAFALYAHANLLQRDMCPSGTKFEGEVIAMTAKMLHGDAVKEVNPKDEVCGAITSGGSESIFNAMLVYREWAQRERGIEHPEIVAPSTIHTAFQKSAHYLGLKLVRTPVTADFVADVDAMAAAITPNTIALAGSAGNYAYGTIDPIARLSDLALARNLGLHVDGCLGGFLLPWVERLGYDVPIFDFRQPGVTSISCDTHKYGYALKGTSVILLRNEHLRHFQYFTAPDWAGGLYASPTFQGSRSGGLAAATWAAMVAMGEDGYLAAARAIMNTADRIRAGIASIPEIRIAGKTTFLIGMMSDEVDIFHVNDYLIGRGWRMNGLQLPPGIHFCITLPQTQPGVAERFVEDLRTAVAYARDPQQEYPQSGAVYGLSATLDGQAMLSDIMLAYLDATYGVE
ncbi:MAG: aminotransferase class V-fold PLP-dependent enzyme [Anaerolineales bacterium]|nr:aminotransferase class V-fold PLP-dependent enzyme [Anaerolineales bacterium]